MVALAAFGFGQGLLGQGAGTTQMQGPELLAGGGVGELIQSLGQLHQVAVGVVVDPSLRVSHVVSFLRGLSVVVEVGQASGGRRCRA